MMPVAMGLTILGIFVGLVITFGILVYRETRY